MNENFENEFSVNVEANAEADVNLSVYLDYENYIIVSHKLLSDLYKIAQPYSILSGSPDAMKVTFNCTDANTVAVTYLSEPSIRLHYTLDNSSGYTVPRFDISLTTLKYLLSATYSTVVIVFKNDCYYFGVGSHIVLLATLENKDTVSELPNTAIDFTEVSSQAWYKYADFADSVLGFAMFGGEKCLVNSEGVSRFYITSLLGVCESPIRESCLLFKDVINIFKILGDTRYGSTAYTIINDELILYSKYLYVTIKINRDISRFRYESLDVLLDFEPSISLEQDVIEELISITSNFDYFARVVKFMLSPRTLTVTLYSLNIRESDSGDYSNSYGKPENYKFNIVNSGESEISSGSVLLPAENVNILLKGCTTYSYYISPNGLGFYHKCGKVLVRATK